MGRQIARIFRAFLRDEHGASLTEYALLVTLIAIVCVIAVTSFGTSVQNLFTNGTGSV